MDIRRFFCILHTVFNNQEYNNRRAGGAGLWIESHKRSEAETRKKQQGSIDRYFLLESISFLEWRMSMLTGVNDGLGPAFGFRFQIVCNLLKGAPFRVLMFPQGIEPVRNGLSREGIQ